MLGIECTECIILMPSFMFYMSSCNTIRKYKHTHTRTVVYDKSNDTVFDDFNKTHERGLVP